jgi:hypothetical protein
MYPSGRGTCTFLFGTSGPCMYVVRMTTHRIRMYPRKTREIKDEKDTDHHDSSRIKSVARKKKKTLDPWDWGMRRQQHSPALLRSLFPRRRRVELSPRQRPLASMIRFQSDPPPRRMAAKRWVPSQSQSRSIAAGCSGSQYCCVADSNRC